MGGPLMLNVYAVCHPHQRRGRNLADWNSRKKRTISRSKLIGYHMRMIVYGFLSVLGVVSD